MDLVKDAIEATLGAVKAMAENPQQAEELKDALLEIRDAINALYPDQPAPDSTTTT